MSRPFYSIRGHPGRDLRSFRSERSCPIHDVLGAAGRDTGHFQEGFDLSESKMAHAVAHNTKTAE